MLILGWRRGLRGNLRLMWMIVRLLRWLRVVILLVVLMLLVLLLLSMLRLDVVMRFLVFRVGCVIWVRWLRRRLVCRCLCRVVRVVMVSRWMFVRVILMRLR